MVLESCYQDAPLCPTCGYRMEWRECEDCEDGHTPFGQLHEEDPLWYDLDDVEPCQVCDGAGGWWRCPNTPAWCAAHPAAAPEST